MPRARNAERLRSLSEHAALPGAPWLPARALSIATPHRLLQRAASFACRAVEGLRTFQRPSLLPVPCLLLLFTLTAHAQLSLPAAVDLGLSSNPRIKVAQADVARAQAQLQQTHDVYVPSLNAGAGLGQAYGYSPYPPTLFTFNSGSLLYNPAQRYYIRSARAGLDAARHSLDEVRDSVTEEIAQAYLNLQHDQQRLDVITQQSEYSHKLVAIVQDRANLGQAAPIDLTQAQLTAANLNLSLIHTQDDVANDRDHLARLIGVSPGSLTVGPDFPAGPGFDPGVPPEGESANPGVSSAYANALARQQQAIGDASFRFRPQVNLVVQYNRYATFTNSWNNIENEYKNNNCKPGQVCGIGANEYVLGVQISVPLYDRYRMAKARETAANASHDLHEAENIKLTTLDAQARIRHSLPEIAARAEVARLQQQYAQQQIDILRVQLQSGNPNGPQMTPADEQNSLIAERDKYLQVIDAQFQLHNAQLELLRLTGRIGPWLRSAGPGAPLPASATPPLPGTTPSGSPAPQLPPAPTPH